MPQNLSALFGDKKHNDSIQLAKQTTPAAALPAEAQEIQPSALPIYLSNLTYFGKAMICQLDEEHWPDIDCTLTSETKLKLV